MENPEHEPIPAEAPEKTVEPYPIEPVAPDEGPPQGDEHNVQAVDAEPVVEPVTAPYVHPDAVGVVRREREVPSDLTDGGTHGLPRAESDLGVTFRASGGVRPQNRMLAPRPALTDLSWGGGQ